MGNLKYTVTFYPQACLVHVNLAPIVVTLVHKDGQGDSDKLNFGDALNLIPELTRALDPLREQVRETSRHNRVVRGIPSRVRGDVTSPGSHGGRRAAGWAAQRELLWKKS